MPSYSYSTKLLILYVRKGGEQVPARAFTWGSVGTLANKDYIADPGVISHELGHYVGYVGDAADGIHSKDPNNIMYITAPNDGHADKQWCDKVLKLLK